MTLRTVSLYAPLWAWLPLGGILIFMLFAWPDLPWWFKLWPLWLYILTLIPYALAIYIGVTAR